MIVDNAVYVDGARTTNPVSLEETFETMRDRGGLAWIDLHRPDSAELNAVAAEFGLHPLAVEDAVQAHQRPKIERYGDVLFVVLRPAVYLEETERIELGELHIFVGPDFVVTVRQTRSTGLSAVRERLEHEQLMLSLGPQAILYAIIDHVVDGYGPVLKGLQNDIDEIEDQIFDRDPEVSRRIYELTREVAIFLRAIRPVNEIVELLERGSEKYCVDPELQHSLRDVADHARRWSEAVESMRELLRDALAVHTTLVAQLQNDAMQLQAEQSKKVSSWAAILFAPTVVGGIYGMNFRHMPELSWVGGYPMAIAMMFGLGFGLWAIFKSKHWL